MSCELPGENEAIDLLRRAGCSENVIRHCIAVSKIAVDLAEKLKAKAQKVDVQLVKIGALLHDLGRGKTHTLDHVIAGSRIARSMGLPHNVVSIIARHAGGGISRDEAEKLRWPKGDYIPKTLEEKIVCYADKLVDGDGNFSVENFLKELASRLGRDHPALERVRKLDEEMKSLLHRDKT